MKYKVILASIQEAENKEQAWLQLEAQLRKLDLSGIAVAVERMKDA